MVEKYNCQNYEKGRENVVHPLIYLLIYLLSAKRMRKTLSGIERQQLNFLKLMQFISTG